MNTLKLLLVDDHGLVRAGFRSLLATIPGVEVVGEASNGREALQAISDKLPDIVLMDIGMKGLNGLEALIRAKKDFPATRIIIVSMHDDSAHVVGAFDAGADGYLLKEAVTSELELAIHYVSRGEKYFSPPISKYLVDHKQGESDKESVVSILTPRQREILQLIAERYSTKEIAHILGLSTKTVETHRSLLMERLSIYDTRGLEEYAIRKQIVAPHVH
jgi:DNA-binding NarL/FixJ family response regulator